MNLLINYLGLVIWKYLPLLRPANVKIDGRLIISKKTIIKLNKNSKLNISGNADLSDSILNLKNSEFSCKNLVANACVIEIVDSKVELGDFIHIKDSKISLKDSILNGHNHFRIHNYSLKLVNSKANVSDYFLFEGNKWAIPEFDMSNSNFKAGSNIRIQANAGIVNSDFSIGNNSFINRGTVLSCRKGIAIGNYVMISYDCIIMDNNSHYLNYSYRRNEIDDGFPNGTKQNQMNKLDKAPVLIEDDVWIGLRCMIFKGVTIKARSVLAANAIVTKNIESDLLVYGNPNKYKAIK
jgi:acetyltransferase-like isoleucine patch superfamily enzyme